MRWAQTQRMNFIHLTLAATGWINRRDLMDAFGISMPQAAIDLREFKKLWPKAIQYNASSKRYEATRASLMDAPADTPAKGISV